MKEIPRLTLLAELSENVTATKDDGLGVPVLLTSDASGDKNVWAYHSQKIMEKAEKVS